MLPNPKKTKKKFYNKYIYKVTLVLEGVFLLKNATASTLKNLNVESRALKYWSFHEAASVVTNKQTLVDLFFILNTHHEQSAFRVEGNTIDVYTNEYNLYMMLCSEFDQYVTKRYQPPKGLEKDMLDSKKTIFVNHLPHDKFNYRVYLLPHKLSHNRHEIADWLSKQTETTSISESLLNWIKTHNRNYDRRYLLVKDEQTLLMMQLRCPELIGSVQQYKVIA